MENILASIYQILQKLIGFHRQFLETVRMEREALVAADVKGVQETTYAKETIIESIRIVENERLKRLVELSILWKRPVKELTLPNIIIQIQGRDLKEAEKFRSSYHALTLLIQRIRDQNEDNLALVERSLEHIHNMKRNVLGEGQPRTEVYTSRGQKTNGPGGARLISKEV